MTHQQKANAMLQEGIEDAVFAVAGNSITQSAKTDIATLHKLFYAEVRKYISSNRFNVDFMDQIVSRKNFFHHFVLDPISDDLQQILLKKYPEIVTKEKCEKMWERFKHIQKASRNSYLPDYNSKFVNAPAKSGTYTSPDEAALLEIWKKARIDKVQENADKVSLSARLRVI